jgi:hypothetical protein
VYVNIGFFVDSAAARAMMTALELRMQSPAMAAFMQTAAVPYIQQRIAARFAGEGDDVVGKWHPLALETEVIRIRHGYPGPHPINVRTGQMRAFLTGSVGDVMSSSGVTQLAYPSQAGMGGNLARKIMTAQLGSQFPTTPPRPVLGFNMNDNIALTAMLSGYLIP